MHGHGLLFAVHVYGGVLNADPIGQVVAGRHVQDLELALAAAGEVLGTFLVELEHMRRALLVAAVWRKERDGRLARRDTAERLRIPVDVRLRYLPAPLHKRREIRVDLAHDELRCRPIQPGPTALSP